MVKKDTTFSECFNTPDEDKERILKIKTQEWNEKKKKGVAAVEVEADGADKTGTKEGLPDHNLVLFLLGYDLINVGSVEEEDTSEVIPVFDDFDGDTVNGLGFVEVADVTDNEPGKIRAFTSAGDVKNSSTTKKVPTDRKQTQISRNYMYTTYSDRKSVVYI